MTSPPPLAASPSGIILAPHTTTISPDFTPWYARGYIDSDLARSAALDGGRSADRRRSASSWRAPACGGIGVPWPGLLEHPASTTRAKGSTTAVNRGVVIVRS